MSHQACWAAHSGRCAGVPPRPRPSEAMCCHPHCPAIQTLDSPGSAGACRAPARPLPCPSRLHHWQQRQGTAEQRHSIDSTLHIHAGLPRTTDGMACPLEALLGPAGRPISMGSGWLHTPCTVPCPLKWQACREDGVEQGHVRVHEWSHRMQSIRSGERSAPIGGGMACGQWREGGGMSGGPLVCTAGKRLGRQRGAGKQPGCAPQLPPFEPSSRAAWQQPSERMKGQEQFDYSR